MSEIAEKLDEAAKLIERGWTQGNYARDENGLETWLEDQDAVCWCAMGALYRVTADNAAWKALGTAIGVDPLKDAFKVAEWNDAPGRTQAEVVAAFRRAAALARADQSGAA